MIELWESIKNHGSYEISNLGNVRSVDRVITYKDGRVYKALGKILNFNIVQGYCAVHLYESSKRKSRRVHVLVAEAFLQNLENLPDVNHIDGNKRNNEVLNLEWTSRLQNMQHGFKTGLINNTGTNHGNNIYTDDQIVEVKRMLVLKRPHKEIEAATGVKKSTVEQISQDRQWTHI